MHFVVQFAKEVLDFFALTAFQLNFFGLAIFLLSVLAMNIGTYCGPEKRGCWLYATFNHRVAHTWWGGALFSYGPKSLLFRLILFFAALSMMIGAMASELWGFVILNFSNVIYTTLPPAMIRRLLHSRLEKLLGYILTEPKPQQLLLVLPIFGLILGTAFAEVDMSWWKNACQFAGCYYLMLIYFALFAGYWPKEKPLVTTGFFISWMLLGIGAYLSGPPGYPFVGLELGIAAIQALFLWQERQVKKMQREG